MNVGSKEWLEEVAEQNPNMQMMPGYEDCIVGVGRQCNRAFIVYDREKVISKLMKDGMTQEEADEFHEYNQVGAWVGDGTPCFLEQ